MGTLLLLVVAVAIVVILSYGLLERVLIRRQIQKEFEQIDYSFSYEDYTSQGIMIAIMDTRYLRRMEGIEKVAKYLDTSHKWRAQLKFLEMWEVWQEEGRSFRMLRGKNLV